MNRTFTTVDRASVMSARASSAVFIKLDVHHFPLIPSLTHPAHCDDVAAMSAVDPLQAFGEIGPFGAVPAIAKAYVPECAMGRGALS